MSKEGKLELGIALLFILLLTAVSYIGYQRFSAHPAAQNAALVDKNFEVWFGNAGQRISYRDLNRQIFCSEPSPDASIDLTQVDAIKLALAAGKGPLSAAIDMGNAGASAASSNAIFRRSQSIQYLRDSMFFLCQAYMNNVIEAADYKKAQNDVIRKTFKLLQVELRSGPLGDNEDEEQASADDKAHGSRAAKK